MEDEIQTEYKIPSKLIGKCDEEILSWAREILLGQESDLDKKIIRMIREGILKEVSLISKVEGVFICGKFYPTEPGDFGDLFTRKVKVDVKVNVKVVDEKEKKLKERRERKKIGETLQSDFRPAIIKILKDMGGSGNIKKVMNEISKTFKFKRGDLMMVCRGGNGSRTDRELRWKNSVRWERRRMVVKGILKKGSPKGIWELE